MKLVHAIWFATALTVAACGSKKKDQAEPANPTDPTTDPAKPAEPTEPTEPVAVADTPPAEEPLDLPIETDFEELAAAEIEEKNLEARLKDLEKELEE
jgi:hypothetical protein